MMYFSKNLEFHPFAEGNARSSQGFATNLSFHGGERLARVLANVRLKYRTVLQPLHSGLGHEWQYGIEEASIE
ncbi:MAG: hypothetical protein RLY14_1822 [Planctomycetota bacterium]|jgi:fido (protein-threonine AMPylation protein)